MEKNNYTNEYVYTALFKLMAIKDFEDISISEITNKAGISRVTYYRNFSSKTDIIIKYFDKKSNDFSAQFGTSKKFHNFKEFAYQAFKSFKENKEIFKLLVKNHLMDIYLNYLTEKMKINFEKNQLGDIYLSAICSGALFNIGMMWLKNDCVESIEYISNTLCDFLSVD